MGTAAAVWIAWGSVTSPMSTAVRPGVSGNVEHLLHAGPAQVAADEHDTVARLGERDRQVDGHHRLALAGRRAGDLHDPHLALDAEELDRRAQQAERLGRRRGRMQ